MQITVNGKRTEVSDKTTAADLVEQLGLADKRIAMEVNRDIVPRSQYPQHRLEPGDRVEIVHAIGGG